MCENDGSATVSGLEHEVEAEEEEPGAHMLNQKRS